MNQTIQTPAQLQLIGPSQCGKSTKLLELVKHDHVLFDRPFDRVIYAVPGVENRQSYVLQLKAICARAGKRLQIASVVPSAEEILSSSGSSGSSDSSGGESAAAAAAAAAAAEGSDQLSAATVTPESHRAQHKRGHTLLILDDLTCFPDLSSLPTLSSMVAHHGDVSIMYCLQNPYQRSSKIDLTTLARNLTGRFIFYQTNDWRMYSLLNSALFPDNKGFLTDCLLQAKKEGYNYVFVNTHSHTTIPRRYMCYTALVPGESTLPNGSPLFFDLYDTSWRTQ